MNLNSTPSSLSMAQDVPPNYVKDILQLLSQWKVCACVSLLLVGIYVHEQNQSHEYDLQVYNTSFNFNYKLMREWACLDAMHWVIT